MWGLFPGNGFPPTAVHPAVSPSVLYVPIRSRGSLAWMQFCNLADIRCEQLFLVPIDVPLTLGCDSHHLMRDTKHAPGNSMDRKALHFRAFNIFVAMPPPMSAHSCITILSLPCRLFNRNEFYRLSFRKGTWLAAGGMDSMPAWTLDQVAGLAFGVSLQVAQGSINHLSCCPPTNQWMLKYG